MNKFLENQIEKNLALSLLDFKNEKDILDFLKEFLTKKEFEILSKRLSVLYWLSKNRTYENIMTNLKVSSATIAESSKLLKGKSIEKTLKKIDADVWATKWSSRLGELLQTKKTLTSKH